MHCACARALVCALSLAGKAMDAYAPIGPAIVTTDEIGDPHALGIRCFLNGASVQVRVWLAVGILLS